MAPPILRKILGPNLLRFDPSKPLFVRRRISLGPDADGVMRWLEPGAPFDASTVKPMRVRALFSSRHLAHEKPGEAIDIRGRRIQPPTVDVAPAVDTPPPAKGKAKRATAEA